MAELINLRAARKRRRRHEHDIQAQANRLAHGQPGHRRAQDAAKRAKADRDLDGHRIEKGEER
jgi:hypothetical protein